MKRTRIISTLAGACLFALSTGAVAQQNGQLDIPRTISYQGMLTSTYGAPLADGENSITVTLYADPAGTIPIWQETQNATITNGIFNLYLGSTQPLPPSSEMNRPLWVGTALNGEQEMRPLTPLTASPYALNLPDRAVTTEKLADGAVTEEKVAMDYVKGFRVNGQEISGKGAVLDIRGSEDIALSYDEATGSLRIGQAGSHTHDKEKSGAEVQGTEEDAWGARGDLLDPGTHDHVTADNDDWIGTRDNYNFTIQVNNSGAATGGNQRVMQYQPNAVSANILGGHNANTIGTGVGNIVAGGGTSVSPNNIADETDYAVIAGGSNNNINEHSDWAVIGGGATNTIHTTSSHSVIGGGQTNTIHPFVFAATLGGGYQNEITSFADNSTIGGGASNFAEATYVTIGGGSANKAKSNYSTVSGGRGNEILNGGSSNGTISGGRSNRIGTVNDPARFATVGGGQNNFVYTDHAVIAGGHSNIIETGVPNSFIGGGRENKITASTDVDVTGSVISGGSYNTVGANTGFSAIGGGSGNEITANGTIWNPNFLHATIPGGDNLTAQSWAQTVVGGYNLPKGSVPSRVVGGGNRKEPIFIVGAGYDNGVDMTRFNAFEVSYNGHSTVYHTNGTGAATPAIRGTSYTDNTVYAWAYAVPVAAIPMGGTVEVECDFGVANIQYINTGHYLVTMNLEKPEDDGTFSPMQLDCGSVTANIVHEGPTCAFINTSRISANTFNIYISNLSCTPVDLPFTFKVTGRP